MRRRAFTLVEVMAVVLLLGLVAGAVAWSLAEDVRRDRREGILGRIAYTDRIARLAGRRLGAASVVRFDLGRQHVRRVAGLDGDGPNQTHAVRAPAGHRIRRIVLPGDYPAVSGRGGRWKAKRAAEIDAGVVDIAVSAAGRSVSYAVEVASADGATWLVFSGLTGEVRRVEDEDEVYSLFALLTAGRPDPR